MNTLEKTDYILESRCCGTKFVDEKWELDCPNRDGAALIFANYAKKQLEVKENLPGLYKYSDLVAGLQSAERVRCAGHL